MRTTTGPAVTRRRTAPRRETPAPAEPAGRAGAGRTAATAGGPRRARAEAPRPIVSPGNLRVLLLLLVVLNMFGLVMVLSASSIVSIRQFHTPWHYFSRQCVWLVVGIGAFAIGMRSDLRLWRRLSPLLMLATLGALLAVLVPGVGVSAAGASRWLGTSTIELQPSELAKLALVLFGANVLDRRHLARDWRYEMMPVIAVFVIMAALILKQPDMGTTMVLATITLAMLFTAGLPGRPLLGLIGTGGAAALVMAVAAPYRMQRLMSFRDPFKHSTDTGYQLAQGILSLSNGGLGGNGIGASIASYGFLPNAQTDFIFAVIGEETGLVGTLLVSSLFACVAFIGIRIACRARDRFAALTATGITAWLVGQAVINIGSVIGLLPVTGVPLPFVSFGGSALVIALFAAGLLANVARRP